MNSGTVTSATTDIKILPELNLNYKAVKNTFDVNDYLRSQIYGNLDYVNNFKGIQELRAGMGFKYYF